MPLLPQLYMRDYGFCCQCYNEITFHLPIYIYTHLDFYLQNVMPIINHCDFF